jgi:hypothetical protein
MKVSGLRRALARGGVRRQKVALQHRNLVKMSRECLGGRQPAHTRTNDNYVLSNNT